MSLTPDVTFYHPLEGKCSCGVDFSQAKPKGWEKRQVFDLPPLEIVVTEHCAEKKQCVCGINHRAVFPTGVIAPVQYGPRVRAMGVYLLSVQLLPYERTTQTLSDLVSVDLSEGSLDHFLETAYSLGVKKLSEGWKPSSSRALWM
jgi:transposase